MGASASGSRLAAAQIDIGCTHAARGEYSMTTAFRLYRGFEIYPLVYPHRATQTGFGHNYDEGFDASVRISESDTAVAPPRSRVFRVPGTRPFESAGDARRASAIYAEQLIDGCGVDHTVWDQQ